MKQGSSFYESPEITVMKFVTEDVIRTSNPAPDSSIPEGAGENNSNWFN